jgi:hypothetical protein
MQRRTAQVSFDLSQLQHQYFRLTSVCDAVMHIALRSPRDKQFFVDGENVVPDVYYVLDKVGTLYSFPGKLLGLAYKLAVSADRGFFREGADWPVAWCDRQSSHCGGGYRHWRLL